jgi:6-phosphogluconolactonase
VTAIKDASSFFTIVGEEKGKVNKIVAQAAFSSLLIEDMMINRRLFLTLAIARLASAARKQAKYFVYVGTYTGPQSKGIYSYRFDASSGELEPMGLAAEVINPSWVTIHPNRKFLYAVSELGNNGKENGAVTAFAIDPKTGALTRLNSVSSVGGGACHVVVDKTGHTLLVANYGAGSVAAIPVAADGRLGDPPVLIQHSGASVDPRRQRGPHAHGVFLSADNRFLFVPDLGLDQVMQYRLDAAKASIAPNDPPFAKVPAGSGPRHFAFHPKGKYAYVVNEMKSTVTAFTYDAARGSLQEMQNISTLPKDFTGEDNSAEIEVDAKGRFLYASNRGHDSIAVFAIAKNGRLSVVEVVPTQGKAPRSFRIDPTGSYLLAANQDTGSIVQFRIDSKTGRLTATGKKVELFKPVCIQFVAVEKG